jgi:hypothetical protein
VTSGIKTVSIDLMEPGAHRDHYTLIQPTGKAGINKDKLDSLQPNGDLRDTGTLIAIYSPEE